MNEPQKLTFDIGILHLVLPQYEPGRPTEIFLQKEVSGEQKSLLLAGGRVRFGQGRPEFDQGHAGNTSGFSVDFRSNRAIFDGDWPFEGSYLNLGDLVMGPIQNLRIIPPQQAEQAAA